MSTNLHIPAQTHQRSGVSQHTQAAVPLSYEVAMTISEKDSVPASRLPDILFWLAVRDHQRRYASDAESRSTVEVQDEHRYGLRTNHSQDQRRQSDRSSTISSMAPRLSIADAPVSYFMDSWGDTMRDTEVITPWSCRARVDVNTAPAYQNLPDFGPIGSCRNTNPSNNTSDIGAKTAAAPTANLAALRNGSTPLCSLHRAATFAQEPQPPLDTSPRANPAIILDKYLSEPSSSHPFEQRLAQSSWTPYKSVHAPTCASQPRQVSCVHVQQDNSPPYLSDAVILSPPTPRNFIPTNMALERNRASPGGSHVDALGGYRGDLNSKFSLRQVFFLADAYNCTLWLCNIPSSVQICEVFDTINTGAVSCLHMMPPDQHHSTAAAKLAFMSPEAAAIFKLRVDSREGVWFHGSRIVSRYNRQGNLRDDSSQSRCVRIEGPGNIMTVGFWYAYFQQICVFQWDRVLELPCRTAARKVLQFNFTRISGQAETCMGAIRAQEEFSGTVQATFAVDPCGNQTARTTQQQGLRVF